MGKVSSDIDSSGLSVSMQKRYSKAHKDGKLRQFLYTAAKEELTQLNKINTLISTWEPG